MKKNAFTAAHTRAFTLIELLVVVGVITILASITMPALLQAFRTGHDVKCVSNLGQIARSSIAYTKDNNELLVSGGNRNGEHDWNTSGPRNTDTGPVFDGPWDRLNWNKDWRFPFWYEALQPYVNRSATYAAAVQSYKDRTGTTLSIENSGHRDKLRTEMTRLCRIYTCPAKKQTPMGYGFNYAAVYGVSGIFHWNRSSDSGDGNPFFPDYRWYTYNVKTKVLEQRPAPIMRHHDQWDLLVQQAVLTLWYAQSIPASALTCPSRTIAFCDTGWVTNDADLTTPAEEWEEDNRNNTTGYTRFPLDLGINEQAYVSSAKYKTDRPWRPVPRHKGKVCISNFDGSARRVPIHEVVGYPYGHGKCLYSNRARKPSPLSPYQ